MSQSPDRELRFVAEELRIVDGEKPKITGYAAVFNSLSQDLGGFRELILPGAFAESLSAERDVLALMHHDTKLIIGRRSVNTLSLIEDTHGLRIEITPSNTSAGRDALEHVRSGDIRGMSFSFTKAKDTWTRDGAGVVRTIHSFRQLNEVSLTPVPAYTATSVEVRDALKRFEGNPDQWMNDAASRRLRLAAAK